MLVRSPAHPPTSAPSPKRKPSLKRELALWNTHAASTRDRKAAATAWLGGFAAQQFARHSPLLCPNAMPVYTRTHTQGVPGHALPPPHTHTCGIRCHDDLCVPRPVCVYMVHGLPQIRHHFQRDLFGGVLVAGGGCWGQAQQGHNSLPAIRLQRGRGGHRLSSTKPLLAASAASCSLWAHGAGDAWASLPGATHLDARCLQRSLQHNQP